MCQHRTNRSFWIPILAGLGLCVFASGISAQQTGGAATGSAPAATAQDPVTDASAQLSGSDNQPLPENRQRAIDFLVKELVSLTPGKEACSEALKQAYAEAAGNVVDAKPDDARAKLEAAGAVDTAMPPTDLLLSAMFFAGGNPTQGSALLENAALKNSGYPLIYIAFARLAISQQRRTDARVLLEKADGLISAGTWPEAQKSFFADSNLDATADVLMLDENFDGARQALVKLRAADPKNSRAVLRLAEVAFRQDKVDESLGLLQEYHASEKNSRVAELMLATFFQQTGKPEMAAQWVQKAFDTHPDKVPVLTEYAAFRVNEENFEEANKALVEVEKLAGDMPIATLLRGKMAFAQQSYELAESRFAELFKLEPTNAEIANLWAMALAESSSSDKLAKALEQAQLNMQKQPQNPFAATVLGWVYFRQKNYEQANVWFSRAAQSRDLPPEAAYYFARFLQHVGQTEQALELITGALETKNLFLYRNSAVALKGELTAAKN
jgi:predicted Zn-dependent protease